MTEITENAGSGLLSTTPGERLRPQVEYWPLTTFFAWVLVGWGLWLLLVATLEATGHTPPDPESVPTSAIVLGFFARLYATKLQHGMVVLLIGTALYALFQAWALARDEAWLDAAGESGATPKAGAALIAAFAGRPAGFWRDLGCDAAADAAEPLRRRVFAEHLRFGGAAGMMPLRFALWAFPMFGFLGTVIGLSAAIGELSVIVSRQGGVSADTLAPVLVNLNVAFDTTIQGIVSAVLVILLVAVLDRGWERLGHRLKLLDAPAVGLAPAHAATEPERAAA